MHELEKKKILMDRIEANQYMRRNVSSGDAPTESPTLFMKSPPNNLLGTRLLLLSSLSLSFQKPNLLF